MNNEDPIIEAEAELQKMNDLFVRRADGYVNATILCKAFGKKVARLRHI
jgi:hypothetical protein